MDWELRCWEGVVEGWGKMKQKTVRYIDKCTWINRKVD